MKLKKGTIWAVALVLAIGFVVWYRLPVRCTASLQVTRWDNDLQRPADRAITVEVDMKIYRSLLACWDYAGTLTADGVEYSTRRQYDRPFDYLLALRDRMQGKEQAPAFGYREGEAPGGVAGFHSIQYGPGRRTIQQAAITLSGGDLLGLWSTDWDWTYHR